MDELTEALLKAGEELAKDHNWCFDEGIPGTLPTADDAFIKVVTKHLAPLLNTESWKTARIAALKAELAALEA